MELPAWMRTRTRPEPARLRRTRGPRFLRRAVGGFARVLEEMLAHEQRAEAPGLLQSLDPRAKLLGLFALLVTATLLQRPVSLAAAYAFALLLGLASGLPVRRLLRASLTLPLFSAALLAPAALNLVTPGRTVLTLGHLAHSHLGPWALPPVLTLTAPGLFVAGRFLLRIGACVTFALLLTATTRPDRLFRGLRGLGLPRVFVLLLGMMVNYLAVFLRAAQEIHLARISRTAALGPTRREQAWVAAGVGSLLRRTHALGQAVFRAMLSRGYTGEARLLHLARGSSQDWLFLSAAVIFIIFLLRLG